MTFPITSLAASQQVTTLQESQAVSKAAMMQSFVLGESLDVLVLNNTPGNKALLQIKNATLTAESPFPLPIGEKLTVRVDQLKPSVILRVINRDEGESLRINEFLKFQRSNPGALKDLIVAARTLFSGDTLKNLSEYLPEKDLQGMLKTFDQILISKDNISNPLFLKDFIIALGLTGERRLLKALSESVVPEDRKTALTFKEILLKLSSDLLSLQTLPEDMEPEARQQIRQFSNFAEQATKVIESLQVVNILAQEQDGFFTLQVPLQLPDGIRMQDIFIETDGKKNEPGTGKQYRIVLFLDLDALGELAVDAGVRDGRLHCTIKCSDQDTFDFLQDLLLELQNNLTGMDDNPVAVQCLLERNIRAWKQDFLNDFRFYTQNTVDVCV